MAVQHAIFNIKTRKITRVDLTSDEIEREVARVAEYELDHPPVVQTRQELRRAEYPSIDDRLDDLFEKGAFSAGMAAQIQAVNDRNP